MWKENCKNQNLNYFLIFFNIYLFLRHRQSVSGEEAERKRETQNPK